MNIDTLLHNGNDAGAKTSTPSTQIARGGKR